jgi:hypothetical protein
MRALAQPQVLRNAAVAAAVTAIACLPRLARWKESIYPLWYLEAMLFLGCTVLWAFVFGWHTRYSGRPVLTFRPDRVAFILATVAGIANALIQYLFFDPLRRARAPEDFPANLWEWLGTMLFSLCLVDLLVLFAPFDWLLRLSRSIRASAIFTVAFGLFVLWLRQETSSKPLATGLFAAVLCSRAVGAGLSVYLYLRGGVLLVWWCHLLSLSRHLWTLQTG